MRHPLLETKGAPRDLGLAQGVAYRTEIQKNIASYRRALHADRSVLRTILGLSSKASAVARDLSRFFPHHAERYEGLARGAGVLPSDLMEVLAVELGGATGAAPSTLGLHLGVIDQGSAPQPLLLKTVETGARVQRKLVARKTSPDNGYVSIELVFPEVAFSIAGVNECGLAMVASAPSETRAFLDLISAPASLLGQDCLLRFDTAEKAIDWCMTRPAGGFVDLLFADAAGTLMGIEIRGKERKLALPFGGVLLNMPEQARSLALQKQIQHADMSSHEVLWNVLQGHAVGAETILAPCRHGAWFETSSALIVEPHTRSLRWSDHAPCISRFDSLSSVTLEGASDSFRSMHAG